MIDRLIELDKALFLHLNEKHADWLDPIMLVLSSYVFWGLVFCLYAILIYFYAEKFKTQSVLFYVGSVLFSTLLTNAIKLVIQRPRPIHEEMWEGIIHDIEGYSSAYSFYSSHAATSFCVATFSFFFFKKKRYFGYIALVWALGVSYSRIYVSKHYPLDVFTGICFGIIIGYLGYQLLNYYVNRKSN